ncbi:MAG: prepilin-type N-terminal cleavage/methylation domain-containing protein [Phycisphaerales bacterium]|nr:prepilin-type N-terminal cleavage/methylation domain-containing protein [Phycisphaerales bacterium]
MRGPQKTGTGHERAWPTNRGRLGRCDGRLAAIRLFGRVGRGFTLVELLVTTTVIAVLSAILVAGTRSARDAGRRVRCLASVRDWGTAVGYYANDHRGYVPRRGQGIQPVFQINRRADWFNALPPYMHLDRFVDLAGAGRPPKPRDATTWVCPSAVDSGHKYFFAYAMNMMLSTWLAPEPDRLDHIASPNTMVFLADGPGGHCSTVPTFESYSPRARHRGKVNLAFLDGHVESLSAAHVGCGVGDPRRQDVRWVVPGRLWPEPGQPVPPPSTEMP